MTSLPFGQIPQSSALSEASPESLSDLMSKDPEGYQQQDIKKIVAELRGMRERWAKAEAEPKARKAGGAKAVEPLAITEILKGKPKSLEELF